MKTRFVHRFRRFAFGLRSPVGHRGFPTGSTLLRGGRGAVPLAHPWALRALGLLLSLALGLPVPLGFPTGVTRGLGLSLIPHPSSDLCNVTLRPELSRKTRAGLEGELTAGLEGKKLSAKRLQALEQEWDQGMEEFRERFRALHKGDWWDKWVEYEMAESEPSKPSFTREQFAQIPRALGKFLLIVLYEAPSVVRNKMRERDFYSAAMYAGEMKMLVKHIGGHIDLAGPVLNVGLSEYRDVLGELRDFLGDWQDRLNKLFFAAGLEGDEVTKKVGAVVTPEMARQAAEVKQHVVVFAQESLWDPAELRNTLLGEIAESLSIHVPIRIYAFHTGDVREEEVLRRMKESGVSVLQIIRSSGQLSQGWAVAVRNLGQGKLPMGALPALIVKGWLEVNQPVEVDAASYLDLRDVTLQQMLDELARIFA